MDDMSMEGSGMSSGKRAPLMSLQPLPKVGTELPLARGHTIASSFQHSMMDLVSGSSTMDEDASGPIRPHFRKELPRVESSTVLDTQKNSLQTPVNTEGALHIMCIVSDVMSEVSDVVAKWRAGVMRTRRIDTQEEDLPGKRGDIDPGGSEEHWFPSSDPDHSVYFSSNQRQQPAGGHLSMSASFREGHEQQQQDEVSPQTFPCYRSRFLTVFLLFCSYAHTNHAIIWNLLAACFDRQALTCSVAR